MEVRLPAGSWTAIGAAAAGTAIAAVPLAGSHFLLTPSSSFDFVVFALAAALVVAVIVRTTLLDAWNMHIVLGGAAIVALGATGVFAHPGLEEARCTSVDLGISLLLGPVFAGGLAGIILGALAVPSIAATMQARRRFGGVHRAAVICGAWLLAMSVLGASLDPAADTARVGTLLSLAGFVVAVVVLARGIEGVRATRVFVARIRVGDVHDLRLSADGRAILAPVGGALDYRGEHRDWAKVAVLA